MISFLLLFISIITEHFHMPKYGSYIERLQYSAVIMLLKINTATVILFCEFIFVLK